MKAYQSAQNPNSGMIIYNSNNACQFIFEYVNTKLYHFTGKKYCTNAVTIINKITTRKQMAYCVESITEI